MLFDRIPLSSEWPDAWLDTYVGDRPENTDGLLVIPGGGYSRVCSDREGEPIALSFLGMGINCFVLHYTTAPNGVYPQQLLEAALAMKHIKENAARYHVDPDRIFVVGFSAGGHLAGTLGTQWHIPVVAEKMGGNAEIAKPKGMLLCYAVTSQHSGSFKNLFGTETLTEEQLEKSVLPNLVDVQTVPAFIMHTAFDSIVPIYNALEMAEKRHLDEHIRKELEEKNAVAEACGYYFDGKGKVVYETRSIGIDFNEIDKMDCIIVVAGGKKKAESLLAVSHSIPNGIFVTDEEAAMEMLRLAGK